MKTCFTPSIAIFIRFTRWLFPTLLLAQHFTMFIPEPFERLQGYDSQQVLRKLRSLQMIIHGAYHQVPCLLADSLLDSLFLFALLVSSFVLR